MIKARYIGVDNELLQSGKVYKIKTISVRKLHTMQRCIALLR